MVPTRSAHRFAIAPGIAVLAVFLCAPAQAAPRITDAFCKTMMDRSAEIWPLDQVRKCEPWRARRQETLNKAATACRRKDPLSAACDKLDDAATRFWMESEYVEKNRDVPADQANPVLPPHP